MNLRRRVVSTNICVSGKRFWLISILVALCPLLTGCPHNDYTVELRPESRGVERTLTFYRADGSRSNGVPNYQDFPSNELAVITRVYPADAVTRVGQRYVAKGDFTGLLPGDIGGAGSFANFTTDLGDAGFYGERFRGNDDLAANVARRSRAADQITDLVIGWTKTEFGRERGYKKLRKFLDTDFRNDLKNAGLYFWTAQVSALADTNAPEEFAVRFCQYLFERGYLNLSDAPAVYSIVRDSNSPAIQRLIQRLMAGKMGISESDPLPKSFAILTDSAAFEKSWENYLAQTDLYHAKVKEWEVKKKTDPKLAAPEPANAADDLIADLLFGNGGEPDHLTVKLALNHAPNHTNGKWQDGQVIWQGDLDVDRPLPVFCYANWSQADTGFQTAHFGSVILDGDQLAQYCFWLAGIEKEPAREWQLFLSSLQPEQALKAELTAFQFQTAPTQANGEDLDLGRKLLLAALPNKAGESQSAGSK